MCELGEVMAQMYHKLNVLCKPSCVHDVYFLLILTRSFVNICQLFVL